MDLRDTSEQAAFRTRLRTWLGENLPTEPEPEHLSKRFGYTVDWQRALYGGGWVALSWPIEYGGQGLSVFEEAILNEELGRVGAPTSLPLNYLGRPFLTHGTEEQRATYLPGLLAAETIWCQGFSEPEAGSDLASLRTRAVRVDDGWRITGQKLWTSFASFADMCLLLARTSDEGPNYSGISAFIVPMHLPGITVRSLAMGNGDEEFSEVFLDDVIVPAENIVGQVGDGWAIAQATVTYERGAVDIGYLAKFERLYRELVVELSDRSDESNVRRMLGEVATNLEVLRMHGLRRLTIRAGGALPGPESSVDKLLMTRVEQLLLSTAMSLSDDHVGARRGTWFNRYLFARAGSIYGGSSQIQRNILSQRVLGMPRSKAR